MEKPSVYLDNAATSFPKPEAVYQALDAFARSGGGSAGRSGHSKSLDASAKTDGAREALCELLGGYSSEAVCFALNATDALNTAIYGLARPGSRIVTTSMEHNSVWRPLADLRLRHGCTIEVVQAGRDGFCDPRALVAAIARRPDLVVMSHASNVTGTVQDIEAVARACREHGVPLVVDAAQTAGALPIDVRGLGITVLAFTGHKSLLGPQGTGGFIVDPEAAARMLPRRVGGSGTASESEVQPEQLPEKFECGTLNGHGLAGLNAGVRFLLERTVVQVRAHEMSLWQRMRDGLREIPHVRIHGTDDPARSVGIVSITMDGLHPADVGFLLDVRDGVLTRTGLHCAPSAHATIGTMPVGTVRFSLGWSTTTADVDAAVEAIARIRRERARRGPPARRRHPIDASRCHTADPEESSTEAWRTAASSDQ